MKGISRGLIREISERKREPKWMLECRLRALEVYEGMPMPNWGPDLSGLNLDEIETYVKPEKEMVGSWSEVPTEIRRTFEELGIPQAEREQLAGVGAQYDSEMIYHRIREEVGKSGVVYLPMEEAVRDAKWGEVVQEHFMKVVPIDDHKFAALHAALWSGGSFIYVPKGVAVEVPINSYFRMNAPGAGQFEHTMIIVEEGADLHYIEGCSAPKYTTVNLHAGCVELYIGKEARLKYSTVESWSKNVYNLNTKRAVVEEGGRIEWVTGNFGSAVTMLYPAAVLVGRGASCEYLGVSLAGAGQVIDTGVKVIHLGEDTCSKIEARSLAKKGGKNMYRSLVKIGEGAQGARSFADCKTLMLDSSAQADTLPVVEVLNRTATVGHEATVGRIGAEELYFLESRGLDESAAEGLMVRGFVEDVSAELPLEYAMEMNNLIRMEVAENA